MLDQLAGLPAAFVWGNTDFDRASLEEYARSLGIDCRGEMADLTLGGQAASPSSMATISLLRKKLLLKQEHDYILHGHTHVRDDQRVGKTRIINPGALIAHAKRPLHCWTRQPINSDF